MILWWMNIQGALEKSSTLAQCAFDISLMTCCQMASLLADPGESDFGAEGRHRNH